MYKKEELKISFSIFCILSLGFLIFVFQLNLSSAEGLQNRKLILKDRIASIDFYLDEETKENIAIIYSKKVNLKNLSGVYEPYEKTTNFSFDGDNLILKWNNKVVILEIYTINKLGLKEKIKDKSFLDKSYLNLSTKIVMSKGQYYYNHTISKEKDKQPKKLGYNIITQNVTCEQKNYSLICGEQEIDFLTAAKTQNLVVNITYNNIEFSGDDLSYIDPNVKLQNPEGYEDVRWIQESNSWNNPSSTCITDSGSCVEAGTNIGATGNHFYDRAALYFSIADIDPAWDITDVDLQYTINDLEAGSNREYRHYETDASELPALVPFTSSEMEHWWKNIGNGTLYAISSFTSDEQTIVIDLGSTADSNLEKYIDEGDYYFIAGFAEGSLFSDDSIHTVYSDSNNNYDKDGKLIITYNAPSVSIPNVSFNWPQCNPADPCCDINGYFRPNSYVCKGAHDVICNSVNSTTCGGTAYEDRCTGTSAICPDNNYQINYPAACDGSICIGRSCSGSAFQPERTCSAGICQQNFAYDCPNNLNCLNSVSCKRNASSSSDCKSGYVYDIQYNVCWLNQSDISTYGLSYDNNGNLLSAFGFNYSYDEFNRLVNITNNINNLIAQYIYDHEGKRVKKISYNGNQNTTIYYFDNFIQIINASGVYNETYYYYYNKLIGKKDILGKFYFYHHDQLGSISLVTNSSGGVVADLQYKPFGEPKINSDEKFTFAGYEYDPETALFYLTSRYYDPELGQFIQPDNLIGDIYNPQDLNKYAYVRNNPYKYTDSQGEFLDIILDLGFIGFDIYQIARNPKDTVNYLSLGADIAGAFVPFASGFGIGVRGAVKGVEASARSLSFAKAISRTDDIRRVSNGISRGDNVVKGINDANREKNLIEPFTRNNFRENTLRLTGESGAGKEAHHVLPQQFKKEFQTSAGFPEKGPGSIHDPRFASLIEKTPHRKDAYAYNQEWKGFFEENPTPTKEQILKFATDKSKQFKFKVHF